jgi:hypothetical protein
MAGVSYGLGEWHTARTPRKAGRGFISQEIATARGIEAPDWML